MLFVFSFNCTISWSLYDHYAPLICFHSYIVETVVANEMATFIEEWEVVLDELETESSHLLV